MHPDRSRLQLNVLLRGAEHAFDPLCRPMLARPRNVKEDLCIFGRILDAHAAMAVRAEILRKQLLVRRVVMIDRKAIREVETKPAKCVPRTGGWVISTRPPL